MHFYCRQKDSCKAVVSEACINIAECHQKGVNNIISSKKMRVDFGSEFENRSYETLFTEHMVKITVKLRYDGTSNLLFTSKLSKCQKSLN